MRIVLVNWAKIWDGATNGGGVNGYCQGLALEFVQRGHDVSYLSSGTAFYPDSDSDGPGRPFIHRHRDWLGVRIFEVVNSPVLAPSILQFAAPEAETSSPVLESLTADFFAILRPDVVHFHNIEGFSAPCIAAARGPRGDWPGARVVYTLHNYHPICPQVYLMQGGRTPCYDAANGHNCAGCVPAKDPATVRRTLATRARPGQPVPRPDRRGRPAIRRFAGGVRRWLGVIGPPSAPAPPPLPPSPFCNPVRGAGDVAEPLPQPGEDTRGQTAALRIQRDRVDECAHRAPLDNEATPDPRSDREPNAYGRRRRAMIQALNTCDRVLAVSEFVARKFNVLGIRSHVLQTLHIGTRAAALAQILPEPLHTPLPVTTGRAVHLAFMGYNNYYKGLHLLAEALERLPQATLARIHLHVHAQNGRSIARRFRRIEHLLAGLIFREGYEPQDIPWLLAGVDVGIVPSVWWDNGPQTVFEFLACGVPVIGARVGGIPDFIQDGLNGMLFRGNDADDLARRIAEIIESPGKLAALRANVQPPKSMARHAEELESVYDSCRRSEGASLEQSC